MFIWTISDVIGIALLTLAALIFGVVWVQDWFSRRRKARK